MQTYAKLLALVFAPLLIFTFSVKIQSVEAETDSCPSLSDLRAEASACRQAGNIAKIIRDGVNPTNSPDGCLRVICMEHKAPERDCSSMDEANAKIEEECLADGFSIKKVMHNGCERFKCERQLTCEVISEQLSSLGVDTPEYKRFKHIWNQRCEEGDEPKTCQLFPSGILKCDDGTERNIHACLRGKKNGPRHNPNRGRTHRATSCRTETLDDGTTRVSCPNADGESTLTRSFGRGGKASQVMLRKSRVRGRGR